MSVRITVPGLAADCVPTFFANRRDRSPLPPAISSTLSPGPTPLISTANPGVAQPLAVAGTPGSRSELREDPFDHSQALYAEWRTPGGALLGSVLVNGDGQAFAEFDVLLPHPRRPAWVIEAVTAWGRVGALKSELRLLPALES